MVADFKKKKEEEDGCDNKNDNWFTNSLENYWERGIPIVGLDIDVTWAQYKQALKT